MRKSHNCLSVCVRSRACYKHMHKTMLKFSCSHGFHYICWLMYIQTYIHTYTHPCGGLICCCCRCWCSTTEVPNKTTERVIVFTFPILWFSYCCYCCCCCHIILHSNKADLRIFHQHSFCDKSHTWIILKHTFRGMHLKALKPLIKY